MMIQILNTFNSMDCICSMTEYICNINASRAHDTRQRQSVTSSHAGVRSLACSVVVSRNENNSKIK